MMEKIDVIINISGKPYQTILTISTLIKYSGKKINKFYLIFEKKQVFNENMNPLLEYLKTIKYEVKIYKTKINIGIRNLEKYPFSDLIFRYIKRFRYSLRYQYGIEKSKMNWVFLCHNDMIFTKDILSTYLENINDSLGIGSVGQCWNCPAFGKCSGENYWDYRPTKQEVLELYEKSGVQLRGLEIIKKNNFGWPLPECRLNETAALLNNNLLKKLCFPRGNVNPIGYFTYELGVKFFEKVTKKGFRFKHFHPDNFSIHAFLSESSNGHSSFLNFDLYLKEEKLAKEIIETSINDFLENLKLK